MTTQPMRIGTAREVAALLGVHINTVYRMAQTGEIPVAFHVGAGIRFDVDAVLETLKRREVSRG